MGGVGSSLVEPPRQLSYPVTAGRAWLCGALLPFVQDAHKTHHNRLFESIACRLMCCSFFKLRLVARHSKSALLPTIHMVHMAYRGILVFYCEAHVCKER